MCKIVLNSDYSLRNDKSCSYIYMVNDSFDVLLQNRPNALEIPDQSENPVAHVDLIV